MKRLLSIVTCLLLAVVAAHAKYVPNTKWPYVYEDFTKGTVYSADNQKSEGLLNIHLAGNVLHYVGKDGKVYANDNHRIARVEIGQDAYIVVDNRLMQVIGQKGADVLLKLELADFSQLTQSSGGAYGSSLNSSASNQLSSLDLGGLNRPEHGMMLQEKHDGREIPVSTVYYFAIGGQCIEANKGEVLKYVGESRKADFTRFIKEKKVKWKNEDSLKTVLEYLSR